MNTQPIIEVLEGSLMITGFVFVTMLVIEYINILTRGVWQARIYGSRFSQSVLTSLMGALPGCFGNFVVVSLYTHRVVTFGALVAAMIATTGDEAFWMLGLFPRKALWLFALLVGIAVLTGTVIDLILRRRRTTQDHHAREYVAVHEEEARCTCFSRREMVDNWRHCSAHRGWLTIFLVLFVLAVASGKIGHQHPAAPPAGGADVHATSVEPEPAAHEEHGRHEHGEEPQAHMKLATVGLIAMGLIGLFIVATVPEHFLEEHLWNHLARTHLWRIFLWTLGAMAVTHAVIRCLPFQDWIRSAPLSMLLVACVVGLIPESGPHLLFVTLFASGQLPFSILLANSIVQDGHGMLPMLAHSRRGFVAVKAIKFVLGMAAGLIGHFTGW